MTHPDYIVTRISHHEWDVWKEEWSDKLHSFPTPYRVVRVFHSKKEKRLCNCPHFLLRLKQMSDCKHIEMTREGAWNESDFSR